MASSGMQRSSTKDLLATYAKWLANGRQITRLQGKEG